jgi:hypothetical protein
MLAAVPSCLLQKPHQPHEMDREIAKADFFWIFDKNSSISGTLEMVASRLFPSRL